MSSPLNTTRNGFLPDRSPTGIATAIRVTDGEYQPDTVSYPIPAPAGKLYATKEEATRAAARKWRCNG